MMSTRHMPYLMKSISPFINLAASAIYKLPFTILVYGYHVNFNFRTALCTVLAIWSFLQSMAGNTSIYLWTALCTAVLIPIGASSNQQLVISPSLDRTVFCTCQLGLPSISRVVNFTISGPHCALYLPIGASFNQWLVISSPLGPY